MNNDLSARPPRFRKINSRHGLVTLGALVGATALTFFHQRGEAPLNETMESAVDSRPALVKTVVIAGEPIDGASETSIENHDEALAQSREDLFKKIIAVDAMSASVEEADRVAKALENWAKEHGLSPEELYRHFFRLSRSHPDWVLRLGIRMDPEGSGVTAQWAAIRELVEKNDVTKTLDLIAEFGPSGEGMSKLVGSPLHSIMTTDPTAFLAWLNAERDGELGKIILEKLPSNIMQERFPESLRNSLMRDKSIPISVRKAALQYQADQISKQGSNNYRLWVEESLAVFNQSDLVVPVVAAWPINDFAEAERFIGRFEDPEFVQNGWNMIAHRIGEFLTPGQVAETLSRAPVEFVYKRGAIDDLYDRDRELALEAAKRMAPGLKISKAVRWELFLRTLREEHDAAFIQQVIAAETDGGQREVMKKRFAEDVQQ